MKQYKAVTYWTISCPTVNKKLEYIAQFGNYKIGKGFNGFWPTFIKTVCVYPTKHEALIKAKKHALAWNRRNNAIH